MRVLERHFFSPLVGTFAASLCLAGGAAGQAGLGRRGADLQAAVDLVAQGERNLEGYAAKRVFGTQRWASAVARSTAALAGEVALDALREWSSITWPVSKCG